MSRFVLLWIDPSVGGPWLGGRNQIAIYHVINRVGCRNKRMSFAELVPQLLCELLGTNELGVSRERAALERPSRTQPRTCHLCFRCIIWQTPIVCEGVLAVPFARTTLPMVGSSTSVPAGWRVYLGFPKSKGAVSGFSMYAKFSQVRDFWCIVYLVQVQPVDLIARLRLAPAVGLYSASLASILQTFHTLVFG